MSQTNTSRIGATYILNQKALSDIEALSELHVICERHWRKPHPPHIAELIAESFHDREDNRQWLLQLSIIGQCCFGGEQFDQAMMLFSNENNDDQGKWDMHYLMECGHERIPDDRFSSGIVTRGHLMAKLLYLCRDSLPVSAIMALLSTQDQLKEDTVSFLLDNLKDRLSGPHHIAGALADMQPSSLRYPFLLARLSDSYLQVLDTILPAFQRKGGRLSDTVQMHDKRIPLGMFMLDAALSYGGGRSISICEKLIDYGLDIASTRDDMFGIGVLRKIYGADAINRLEHYALTQALKGEVDKSSQSSTKEAPNNFSQFSV